MIGTTSKAPPRVLITGASSGLGLSCAAFFARRDATVFATMRDPTRAPGVFDGRSAGRIESLPLDVCDDASVNGAVKHVLAVAGGVDVLICNAGVELVGPLEYTTASELRWVIETNVVGAHRVVRAVLPTMRAQGFGRIIFISSVVGIAARPLLGAYSASKYALEGLAEALALELEPTGVRVCVVQPGRFPSRLGSNKRRAADWAQDDRTYAATVERTNAAISELEPPHYSPDVNDIAAAVYHAATASSVPPRIPVGADAMATADLLGPRKTDEYYRLFQPAEATAPSP